MKWIKPLLALFAAVVQTIALLLKRERRIADEKDDRQRREAVANGDVDGVSADVDSLRHRFDKVRSREQ